MLATFKELEIMARRTLETLGYQGLDYLKLDLMSVGVNPPGLMTVVYEVEIAGHLHVVEIQELESKEMVGIIRKPFCPHNPTLVFKRFTEWRYRRLMA